MPAVLNGPQAARILEENGLTSSAEFVRTHWQNINFQRFCTLLCSPKYDIHIPLELILCNISIPQNDLSGAEMDQLLQAICGFQSAKKLSENQVGQVLDHILKCHGKNQVIESVPDLTRIFCLLRSPNSSWILDQFSNAGPDFWNTVFNQWAGYFGVMDKIPYQVVNLLNTADISELQRAMLQADSKTVQVFFADLRRIQTSPYSLLDSDWQRIIGRRAGEDGNDLVILHSAILGRCFLNWLAEMDPTAYASEFSSEITSVVMTLVQDKHWRYRDIEKLFRFSKRPEDLPGLLAALMQIQEGNLSSKALDRMPKAIKVKDIDTMMENDRMFNPVTATSREDAIRIIADSDYNEFSHSGAKITVGNLTQLMYHFEDAYKGSGNGFKNLVKAVKTVEAFFKVKMRDVQILGILLATMARKADVSRLLQMQTGEGKTYVIAALAISEVLNGNKVDIITSSSILAITQTRDLQELYASVGITVRHNCDDDAEEKEKSEIYQANVVYGTATSFMFDVLREEFFGAKFRCSRGFPVAIVDEGSLGTVTREVLKLRDMVWNETLWDGKSKA